VWRAISVLAVVLYHLGFEARRIWDGTNATILSPLDRFCCGGVDFFFVISGFIITYKHFDKLGEPQELGKYLWSRLTRIYPVYILISIPSFLQGMLSHQLKLLSLLGAAVLLWPFPFLANPVAWSLSYEMSFYFLFSIAFFLPGRFLPLMLAVWSVCIFGETNHWFRALPEAAYLSFTVLNVAIILGILGALLIKKGVIIFPRICMGIGAALMTAGCIICYLIGNTVTNDLPLRCAFFAIPASLLIYGAVGNEISRQRTYPKWLLHTGDASYSIYLSHYQMIMLAEVLILPFKSQLNPIVWQTATGVVTLATGYLLYQFLEKPLVTIFNKKTKPKSAAIKPTEKFEGELPVTAGEPALTRNA
jgi:exopolysaccharide production protein ExoZ